VEKLDSEEEELVRELAQIALSEVAPEELVVFDETADEFFADPEGVLNPENRDEAVGFGLDAALATPFVLAVVMPVIHYLVNAVADAAKDEANTTVKVLVKRLFRKLGKGDADADKPAEPSTQDETPMFDPPGLTVDEAAQVRAIAYQQGLAVGLPDKQAQLLADAVGGGVLSVD
jgi:hypothetical protein